MNKKTRIILGILFSVLVAGALFFYFTNSSNKTAKKSEYEANKASTEQTKNITTNNTINTQAENEKKQQEEITKKQEEEKQIQKAAAEEKEKKPAVTEEEIASFSTKIYSKDSARQNNISITCKALNGKTVKNGETFSFCSTIGPASTSKGYQKADIYDQDGNKKKGLGGGNCQISTTLYNAVLAAPSLVVTERHEHSNSVPYVKKGKDAAVAYGSYDLKFRNNSGNTIKILASTDQSSVTVTLKALK